MVCLRRNTSLPNNNNSITSFWLNWNGKSNKTELYTIQYVHNARNNLQSNQIGTPNRMIQFGRKWLKIKLPKLMDFLCVSPYSRVNERIKYKWMNGHFFTAELILLQRTIKDGGMRNEAWKNNKMEPGQRN